MTFVEVDQKAFAEKAKAAVLDTASNDIKPVIEKIFSEAP